MNRAMACLAALVGVVLVGAAPRLIGADATPATDAAEIAVLKTRLAELEKRVPAPELGHQMLELQIRHDRLWWAGAAGNRNLAYFMVGELGEALHGIEESNGDAPELQPEKLSVVMPSIMDPAIRGVQQALEKKDPAAFAKAFDRLSASCNACHKVAGVDFLHIQRPRTPLLDNLRYEPDAAR
ncbi:MAG: hypothetical protein JSS28_03580 [Proteobacteria bacterium]|nr:hypothetical protein [Pseudomonadota bacterium]